jgi:hypothetical protein
LSTGDGVGAGVAGCGTLGAADGDELVGRAVARVLAGGLEEAAEGGREKEEKVGAGRRVWTRSALDEVVEKGRESRRYPFLQVTPFARATRRWSPAMWSLPKLQAEAAVAPTTPTSMREERERMMARCRGGGRKRVTGVGEGKETRGRGGGEVGERGDEEADGEEAEEKEREAPVVLSSTLDEKSGRCVVSIHPCPRRRWTSERETSRLSSTFDRVGLEAEAKKHSSSPSLPSTGKRTGERAEGWTGGTAIERVAKST